MVEEKGGESLVSEEPTETHAYLGTSMRGLLKLLACLSHSIKVFCYLQMNLILIHLTKVIKKYREDTIKRAECRGT